MHQIKPNFHCKTCLRYEEAKFLVSKKNTEILKKKTWVCVKPLPSSWDFVPSFFLSIFFYSDSFPKV